MINQIRDSFLKWKYRGPDHEHIRKLLEINLEKNDLIIDCGANIGEITEILSRNGSEVIAFEPNPFAFKELSEKFSHRHNIDCIQAGVHVVDSHMKLFLHEWASEDQIHWSSGSSLLSYKSNVNEHDFVDVKVISLAKYILEMNKPVKLIKMDIEGAECEVLTHLIETEAIHRVEHLFVERHDHKIPELAEPMVSLEKLINEKRIKNINLDWI